MIEVTSASGDVDYVESKLQTLLNDGWEVVDIHSFSILINASAKLQTVAYLKKISEA